VGTFLSGVILIWTPKLLCVYVNKIGYSSFSVCITQDCELLAWHTDSLKLWLYLSPRTLICDSSLTVARGGDCESFVVSFQQSALGEYAACPYEGGRLEAVVIFIIATHSNHLLSLIITLVFYHTLLLRCLPGCNHFLVGFSGIKSRKPTNYGNHDISSIPMDTVKKYI
jgi:hypothetical protein